MALLVSPVLVQQRVAHDAVLVETRVQVQRDVVAGVDVGSDLKIDGEPAVPAGQSVVAISGGGGGWERPSRPDSHWDRLTDPVRRT